MKVSFLAVGGILGFILLVAYLIISVVTTNYSGPDSSMWAMAGFGVFLLVPFVGAGIFLGVLVGWITKKKYVSF